MSANDELACVYAALILADDKVAITVSTTAFIFLSLKRIAIESQLVISNIYIYKVR